MRTPWSGGARSCREGAHKESSKRGGGGDCEIQVGCGGGEELVGPASGEGRWQERGHVRGGDQKKAITGDITCIIGGRSGGNK